MPLHTIRWFQETKDNSGSATPMMDECSWWILRHTPSRGPHGGCPNNTSWCDATEASTLSEGGNVNQSLVYTHDLVAASGRKPTERSDVEVDDAIRDPGSKLPGRDRLDCSRNDRRLDDSLNRR